MFLVNRAQDEAQAKDAENADKNKPPSSVGNILPAATTPPMLHTVLCTVVDYKGERFLGQSIIPGVLSQVVW